MQVHHGILLHLPILNNCAILSRRDETYAYITMLVLAEETYYNVSRRDENYAYLTMLVDQHLGTYT